MPFGLSSAFGIFLAILFRASGKNRLPIFRRLRYLKNGVVVCDGMAPHGRNLVALPPLLRRLTAFSVSAGPFDERLRGAFVPSVEANRRGRAALAERAAHRILMR